MLKGDLDFNPSLVLIREQFFHPIIKSEDRTEENQPIIRESDDLLEVVIGGTAVQKLGHNFHKSNNGTSSAGISGLPALPTAENKPALPKKTGERTLSPA